MSTPAPRDPQPPTDADTTQSGAPAIQASLQIGPYRLLRRVGQGGMGEVWLAEQQQPVRRQVALKVIKAGMDTREVIARFEAKRRALALVNHPNIAGVFDAGATPEGRPYFAMEATSQRFTERTVFTELGQLIGTPEYMSPEQAEMLRGVGLADIQRTLREDEPPRPSSRISSLGAGSTVSATNRRVDSPSLEKALAGDLDGITMKALEEDRVRRCDTAHALALDVERHLNDEPVMAGPPSALYRMKKLVHRHRGYVLAAGAVVLALVLGVAATSWALVQAMRAERQRALRDMTMTRGLLVLASGALLCACGGSRPEVIRVQARPAAPTQAVEPGEHPLGLGGSGVSSLVSGRDGVLYIPRRALSPGPLPLLVLLHGGGGRADYFRFTFPLAEDAGVVILTLDARDNTWDGIDSPFGPDVLFIDAALRHTFDRVAVDPQRIALGGVSDGGSYALSLGMANGDLFTHLVAVAPGFIASPGPAIGRPRVFVAHGTRDNVYSVRATRGYLVPQLRSANYDVTYEEFDGPHAVLPATARLIFEWLKR